MKQFILIMILGLFGFREAECRFIVIPPSTAPEKLYTEIHQAADEDIVVLSETASTEKLEKVYQNSKIWMTAEPISFYAGLFKQIKLEDVYKSDFLLSLSELAGAHSLLKVTSKPPRRTSLCSGKRAFKACFGKQEGRSGDFLVRSAYPALCFIRVDGKICERLRTNFSDLSEFRGEIQRRI